MRFTMKQFFICGLVTLVAVTLIYASTWQESDFLPETKSDWEEVIINWVEAPAAQGTPTMPGSEIYSLAFASPGLMKLGLHQWAYQNWISAERHLNDALSLGWIDVRYYKDKAERWQAISTWINTGDYKPIAEIESRNPERYKKFSRLIKQPDSETQEIDYPDISGTWYADIGPDWMYIVTPNKQEREKFSWSFGKFNENAKGEFTSRSAITVEWWGGQGNGSATGTVTCNESGYATQISWSNGVIWKRNPTK
jgi:hypothetical protein